MNVIRHYMIEQGGKFVSFSPDSSNEVSDNLRAAKCGEPPVDYIGVFTIDLRRPLSRHEAGLVLDVLRDKGHSVAFSD